MYQFTSSLVNRKHNLTMPSYNNLTTCKREASKFYANKKKFIVINDANGVLISRRVNGVWVDQ